MNGDNITKPLTVEREEYVSKIVELTNNTNLPFCVMEGALRDLLNQVHIMSQRQYRSDMMQYNRALAKRQNQESKETTD